ncbi:unnamed protein product (macronuclear) [Paramecium tetraurelia]|uniref:Uncharacterized protein n=1 Tax=Paramecium tetraurelia TaxID=5888 RepID=A0C964_PARTE|nr:uncharacterized protein GSPATT00006637001 [Paramecium tetraurelia]CAK67331.1 unnamed protein product [Paramecium tetraurelia]|eukprot:XP_001434728.1 hypothetical protein (macronuclear) [Paramecium tetraurelia strain d4-2]
MGTCGGKHNNNKQIQDNLIYEPSLPADKQTPIEKLNYILSNPIIQYLQTKRQNYDTLINKLVLQMNIQKSEYLSYIELLIGHFKKIQAQSDPVKELIQSAITFMNQDFVQFIKLESLFCESDLQLQLKTFKFFIDLYLILNIIKPEQENDSWFDDYIKIYEEQCHQFSSYNDQTSVQIRLLKHIQKQFIENLQKATIKISQSQKQQHLVKLSSLKDEVISKSTIQSEINATHQARQQNQKYKTPI